MTHALVARLVELVYLTIGRNFTRDAIDAWR